MEIRSAYLSTLGVYGLYVKDVGSQHLAFFLQFLELFSNPSL